MSNSLRDALLGVGFKPAPKPERKPHDKPAHVGKPAPGQVKPGQGKPGQAKPHPSRGPHGRPAHAGKPQQQGKPRTREDIDLAKAYAIRAQKEKDERIEAERLKQIDARLRREERDTAVLADRYPLDGADIESVSEYRLASLLQYPHY